MDSKNQLAMALAAAAVLCWQATQAHAQGATGVPMQLQLDTANPQAPYAVDANYNIVRGAFGQCWHTGSWTPEAAAGAKVVGSTLPAGCHCDKELMPRQVCEPPRPVAAATPAPAPAPAAPPAPAPAPAVTSEKVAIPAETLFAFDSSRLSDQGRAVLDDFISKLQPLNLEAVVVIGHTDRIGTERYNESLSNRRAAAVKTYLTEHGVEAARVFTEGRGETQPTTGDDCRKLGRENGRNSKLVQCLAPDRRVELEAVGSRTTGGGTSQERPDATVR